MRALLLAELAEYREQGVFPRNPGFAGPMPSFIDEHGTRCAMAHLLELGGAGTLVAEIAATRNHAFVAELASDPRVVAWLDAAGLSVEEAARIQPTYCPISAAECVCSEAPPAIARATVVSGDGGAGALRVDEIAGTLTGACASYTVGSILPEGYGSPRSGTVTTVTLALKGVGAECRVGSPYFVSQDGVASCQRGSLTRLPSELSPTELLAALSSDDCGAALGARGSDWTAVPECSNRHGQSGDAPDLTAAGGGCSTTDHGAASGGLATAVILAALLAARVRRRGFRDS